ncbi:hypothetical protein P5673_014856 [Acropora cervicornis]|uniref:Uncharacterized protein n=1 Tax=Acropora cervicornis TaxID=6130 RepID=A0AAD9QJL3_ACRCE|nr:hypothetical protein P5673_014856 [Acropora cervicornis]
MEMRLKAVSKKGDPAVNDIMCLKHRNISNWE